MDFESSLLEIRDCNESLRTFSFAKPAILDYKPGQFLLLSFDKEFTDSHPFSITSIPEDPVIEVTVRTLGNFTQKMHSSPIGTPFWIRAAYGAFTIDKVEGDLVFIAGGVGITPFLSICRSEAKKNMPKKITLFYCVRSHKDIPDKQVLDELSKNYENFKLVYIFSDEAPPGWTGPTGRISKEILAANVENINEKAVFICGPPPLVEFVKGALDELGVTKIHVDNWAYAKKVAKGKE